MKKITLVKIIMMIIAGLFLASCEKNPMDRLADPFDDGALNAWSGVFKIYEDDLLTGGNVSFIPSDPSPPNNNMTLDFLNTDDNPPGGTKCLRYTWNGQDQDWSGKNEHDWAGMSLIVATHWSLYDATPSKDLAAAGYTKITFKACAIIDSDTYVKFEGPISTTTPAPTRGGTRYLRLNSIELGNWQSYTINFSNADFKSVKDYFKIVIEYPKSITDTTLYGHGGIVLVDDIRYER